MAFTDNRPFRWAKIFPMDGLGPSVSKGKVFGETKYGYFVGFIVVSTASRYTTPIRHLKKKPGQNLRIQGCDKTSLEKK